MNFLFKTLTVVCVISFISSCGYSSVDECVVKEQQKGKGASRGDVLNYCKELLRENTKGWREIKLTEGKDYNTYIKGATVVVTNFSDHTINIVKVVGTRECEKSISIDWDEQINYLAGDTISPGSSRDVVGTGQNKCAYIWVGYK